MRKFIPNIVSFSRRKKEKGFTLIEMLTTTAVVGVVIGIFYGVFILNWEAFENYVARADLGQEMDSIVDQVASDGRFARQSNLTTSPSTKQVTFIHPDDGSVIAIYTMKDTGEFIVNRGRNNVVISTRLDFTNSNFSEGGKHVVLKLVLTDSIFGRLINLSSETEIYSRN